MPQRIFIKLFFCFLFLQFNFANAQTFINKLLGGNNSEFYTRNSLDGDGHPVVIRQTNDGGYILVNSTLSSANGDITPTNHGGYDIWVVKFDSEWNIQWQKLLGGNGDEYAFQIHQTTDGGFLIGANSNSSQSGDVSQTSHGDFDFWILKLTSNGNIAWNKLIGGSEMEFLSDLNLTNDGGCIATGFSRSSQSGDITDTNKWDKDYFVVKLTASGQLSWNKLIGSDKTEGPSSIYQTPDGGYIVGGHTDGSDNGEVTNTNHGYYDMWLVKLSPTGTVQWDKLYGGLNYEGMFGLQVASDGYILAGLSQSSSTGDVAGNNKGGYDSWVLKVDNVGNIVWKKSIGGSDDEFVENIYQNPDGSIMLVGYSKSSASGEIISTNHGDYDYWITKFSSTGNILWSKLFGGNGNDRAYSLLKNRSGNYIISGITESSANGDVKGVNKGSTDLWLLTVDDNGNILSTSSAKIDLSLKSNSPNRIVEKDKEGTISFTLKNESTTKATNIKVLLKIPYSPPFVMKNSQNCSKGIFDSNIWTIPELAAGDSCTLNLIYQPIQTGVWYLQAEVFSADQEDSDSNPNNNIDTEDDFARNCMSIPIKVNSDPFGMQLIVEDTKMDVSQWYKDGTPILGATQGNLQVTALGKYNYTTKTFKCPTQSCCPFILEKATTPANCCIPLEYILKN